ncbi:MAG: flagellar biosynthesis regulator FlaF [Alphaproteobacteria bacterium]|nr:flagellar biosynthesis regulator FlaF [Alphaproteobacteria bacterium]
MQSAAQAYGSVAKQSSSPRELEANLLLQAASRLQSIKDGWDAKKSQLEAALLYNRKLWSVFLSTATSGNNPLPPEIRQNIANIGIFVMNHKLETSFDPKPEKLAPLIQINRELAAGLLGRA